MAPITIFLARLIGVSAFLLAVALALTQAVTLDTVALLLHDRPLLTMMAVIQLVAGVAMALRHTILTNITAIVVTVIGYLFILRGLLILVLPPEALLNLFAILNFRMLYFLYVAILCVIGLFLAFIGFRERLAPPRQA